MDITDMGEDGRMLITMSVAGGDILALYGSAQGKELVLDEAIHMCDASNYSKSFFSRKQAEAFVEQLKKQGIKAIITAAADPLNKGSTMYRVEWN